MNDALMEAADVRVKEIVTNFSHTRPDGRKVKTAANEAGFEGNYIGENITGFANTLKWAVDNWTESDGHRENYLNPEYTYTGVAYLYDKDSEYGSYWVQIFAREQIEVNRAGKKEIQKSNCISFLYRENHALDAWFKKAFWR